MNTIQHSARTAALSETLRALHDPILGNKFMEKIKEIPTVLVDLMAKMDGIPEAQFEIYHQNFRGEPNKFKDGLMAHQYRLQPGDVILMNGSPALLAAQKAYYRDARSTHVALVHAEFICIDAMPNPLNVSNRLISEILSGCKPDWRVMRLKSITLRKQKQIHLSCSYYLGQPYAIKKSNGALPGHAYCSELVRKVFYHAKINRHGIPNSKLITPAHFDRLLDADKHWDDVTDEVRSAIEFCREYEAIANSVFRLFIEGFRLNRQRFQEREQWKEMIMGFIASKPITTEKGRATLELIENIEAKMNHRFWDFSGKNKKGE